MILNRKIMLKLLFLFFLGILVSLTPLSLFASDNLTPLQSKAVELVKTYSQAELSKKPVLSVVSPNDLELQLRVLCTWQAMGGDVFNSQYDLYSQNEPKWRVFKDFQQTYPLNIEAYETIAIMGMGISVDKDIPNMPVLAHDPGIYAFTRAIPDSPNDPWIIYLIDWSAKPRWFSFTLNRELFPFDGKLKFTVARPGGELDTYNGDMYVAGKMTITMAPLEPWAMVMVESVANDEK